MDDYSIDLEKRIKKNRARLKDAIYTEDVFGHSGNGWPGDFEGRALLAHVCHLEMGGGKNPTAEHFLDYLEDKLNYNGCLNVRPGKIISEQALSGHSWLLRGLAAHYRMFRDERAVEMMTRITKKLYIPAAEEMENYPLTKRAGGGNVSGNAVATVGKWELSTDVGCAFISLDGLTDVYTIIGGEDLKNAIDKFVNRLTKADIVSLGFQTHAALTAARGLMRIYMYEGGEEYYTLANDIFDRYISDGMTATYENFNWFGRPDSWTEPCAVVDSFILALWFYACTGSEYYRKLARRIYINGMNFCFRPNGGAGTDACVTTSQKHFKTGDLYEAWFCCTMRYAEGLRYAKENFSLLMDGYDEDVPVTREGDRAFKGDRLCHEGAGGRAYPVPRLIKYTDDQVKNINLKIIFGGP